MATASSGGSRRKRSIRGCARDVGQRSWCTGPGGEADQVVDCCRNEDFRGGRLVVQRSMRALGGVEPPAAFDHGPDLGGRGEDLVGLPVRLNPSFRANLPPGRTQTYLCNLVHPSRRISCPTDIGQDFLASQRGKAVWAASHRRTDGQEDIEVSLSVRRVGLTLPCWKAGKPTARGCLGRYFAVGYRDSQYQSTSTEMVHPSIEPPGGFGTTEPICGPFKIGEAMSGRTKFEP
jgi:hypothetical protein